MKRIWPVVIILAPVVTGRAQDVSLSADQVIYDSGLGRFEVVLGLKDAAGLAPLHVAAVDDARGLRAQQTIGKLTGTRASCCLEWPLAALGSRVTITATAKGRVREDNVSNNTVVVALRDAVNRHFEEFYKATLLPDDLDVGRLPSTVYEAEDFPVKEHVKVESAKDASGGKAVRMLRKESRIEWEIELEAGVYLFYAVAMAFRGDQDALNVSLAGVKQRGHLTGYEKWIPQDTYGVARVKAGRHRLVAYYDEPMVLCDKVVVVRAK